MENSQKILEELNIQSAKQYRGGFIFVSILMVIGIVGNLHVLYVYAFRIKNTSNHRTFILMLGLVDFITCIIGMPFILVDLRRPLTFTMVYACKVLRFVNYFNSFSSITLLLIIAVDRYRKICFPFNWQISQHVAICLCIGAFTVGLSLSWPAPVLYGHNTVNTSVPNITGVRCFTEDSFLNTNYQAIFNFVLISYVFATIFIFIVLYSLIGQVISKHNAINSNLKAKYAIQGNEECISTIAALGRTLDTLHVPLNVGTVCNVKTEMASLEITVSDVLEDDCSDVYVKHQNDGWNHQHELVESRTTPMKNMKNRKRFNKAKRTTVMFFLITVVFAISFVPHFILKLIAFVNRDFIPEMSFTEKMLYNTCVWCFFVNNVSNCFIYGFFDVRFRTEVRKIYFAKLQCATK